jgi:hypothetical protein
MRTILHVISVIGLCATGAAFAAEPAVDVVVYGGTSGGVAAAVQAARMGKSVLLIEPGQHLGGLTSGGLGRTDIGNKGAIGGIAREFYQRIHRYYENPAAWQHETFEEYKASRRGMVDEDTMWGFEPHVAEAVYRSMLDEAKVPVLLGQRLDLKSGVSKEGTRITTLILESGKTVRGRMFIDASYEGDLLAKAGVSYAVGRESNAQYDETLNGVQVHKATKHQFNKPVDPYLNAGDPASGLLPGVHAGSPGDEGAADRRVQAYNFRMCLTDVPENRLPIPKPAGYDPLRYELLLRYIEAGWADVLGNHAPMPNRKTDTNNHGAFSTDHIGMNYDYPEADYATREKIVADHRDYQIGLMWTLANSPRVPEKLREQIARWGLAKDEFGDAGNWPHQLYVREARRMIGVYVMTEHNCRGQCVAEDPVGLGAYGMDSHNTQRYVDESGHARNEGDVQVGGFSPYPVSYRAIVPRRSECSNLLVPVCLSATHIAYGSIRMEPVFMVLGQSAATAAVQAIDAGGDVQAIDYPRLQERLLADKQVLAWTGPVRTAKVSLDPAKLPGVVVDDAQAKFTGLWHPGGATSVVVGSGYQHDGNAEKQGKSARFEVRLPKAGRYEVRLAYAPHSNRSTDVPVTIEATDGPHTVHVNQQKTPPIDRLFISLGTFAFEADRPAVVTVTCEGTRGYVIVDAVQFLPEK